MIIHDIYNIHKLHLISLYILIYSSILIIIIIIYIQNNSHISQNGIQNGKDESSLHNTDEQQHENEDEIEHYTPPNVNDFPPLTIPSSTSIYIAEESAEASTGMDLYRGDFGSIGDDCQHVFKAAPSWLLSFLLYVSVYIFFKNISKKERRTNYLHYIKLLYFTL